MPTSVYLSALSPLSFSLTLSNSIGGSSSIDFLHNSPSYLAAGVRRRRARCGGVVHIASSLNLLPLLAAPTNPCRRAHPVSGPPPLLNLCLPSAVCFVDLARSCSRCHPWLDPGHFNHCVYVSVSGGASRGSRVVGRPPSLLAKKIDHNILIR